MKETDEKDSTSNAETISHHSDQIPSPSRVQAPPEEQQTNWWTKVIKLILGQWFLISLGLVILVASQVQVPLSNQKLKATLVSYLCVSIIFFLTGCTLNTRVLLDNYSRWKVHLFVQIQCYLMTSAVYFGVVSLCATNPKFMDAGLLLGMILTGE
jgi:solute carrier family 10 (sodium/bile acid cotransporter), member 7